MLQRHLRAYATELDEQGYRVVFRDHVDHQANLEFNETGALAAPGREDAYRAAFRAKLQTANFQLPAGSRVLDACCGFGYLGRFIADVYGGEIVFCDLSQQQLVTLRERLPRSLSGSAVAADVTRMPYRPGTFDAIVGNSFLHHLPDVPAALAEFRRVLKPAGVLILLHEPSLSANFWESFPLSLIKDTSPLTGFTDLWMFGVSDLARLVSNAGFVRSQIAGTGGLSAIVLNWFLILANKLNWHRRPPLYGAYVLRSWINSLETTL